MATCARCRQELSEGERHCSGCGAMVLRVDGYSTHRLVRLLTRSGLAQGDPFGPGQGFQRGSSPGPAVVYEARLRDQGEGQPLEPFQVGLDQGAGQGGDGGPDELAALREAVTVLSARLAERDALVHALSGRLQNGPRAIAGPLSSVWEPWWKLWR